MNKDEKERILTCVLNQIEKERGPRRTHHLRRAAVIALAAVMILACGAFTVKVLELDSRLAELLGGTGEQMAKSVTDLNASVQNDGLRIEAKQAVGDGHRVYVLMEVTSLTNLRFDKTNDFETTDISMEKSMNTGTSFGPMKDGISKDGKKITYRLEVSSEEPVNEQDITIVMRNFGRMVNVKDEEQKVLIDGRWILDFHLKYKDVSQSYGPKKEIKVGSGSLTVDKVTVSPMSFFIEVSAKQYNDQMVDQWSQIPETFLELKDGSRVPVVPDGSSWGPRGNTVGGSLEGTFDELIDMEQIKSLNIGGCEIIL